MYRIYIGSEADRLTVASILIKNKYTVRQGAENRGTGKRSDYFLEYELGPLQAGGAARKGGTQNDG